MLPYRPCTGGATTGSACPLSQPLPSPPAGTEAREPSLACKSKNCKLRHVAKSQWNQGTLNPSYKNHVSSNYNSVNINSIFQHEKSHQASSAPLISTAGRPLPPAGRWSPRTPTPARRVPPAAPSPTRPHRRAPVPGAVKMKIKLRVGSGGVTPMSRWARSPGGHAEKVPFLQDGVLGLGSSAEYLQRFKILASLKLLPICPASSGLGMGTVTHPRGCGA